MVWYGMDHEVRVRLMDWGHGLESGLGLYGLVRARFGLEVGEA